MVPGVAPGRDAWRAVDHSSPLFKTNKQQRNCFLASHSCIFQLLFSHQTNQWLWLLMTRFNNIAAFSDDIVFLTETSLVDF